MLRHIQRGGFRLASRSPRLNGFNFQSDLYRQKGIFKIGLNGFCTDERKRNENPQENKKPSSARLGVLASAGLMLWGKGKWVLGALKFTKFMPMMSMLASTGAYACFYGFPFAVGMVSLIGVHEAGHLLMMKRLGIPAGPAIFVPFMGAFIEMKGRPKDVKEEALVAFGGPLVGGLGAVGLSVAGVSMESNLLISLADFGLMINLFNLFPIGQLDGGRIGGAISPYMLLGGLGGGIGMIYYGVVTNPIFYLIVLGGGFSTYDRFFGSGTHESYHRIPFDEKLGLSLGYIGLILGLLMAMGWNSQYKKSIKEIRQEDHRPVSELEQRFEKLATDWNDDDEEQYFKDYFGEETKN